MASVRGILQNRILPADPQTSFQGKTVIVTGSNVGLGYEATLKYVNLGADKVIMAVRDAAKGESARSAIEDQTGKRNVLEVWQLDMGSYDSIQAFAARVSRDLARLDIAVLNAGVFKTAYEQSAYGWTQDLQINTLSTTLLALLLLPKLRASKSTAEGALGLPVLEFTSSGLHQTVKLASGAGGNNNILASFNTADKYNAQAQYAASKFLLQFAVQGLASLATIAGQPDVLVISACPGGCQSDLAREYAGSALFRIAYAVLSVVYLRSTEAGARSLVSGTALGPDAHGKFWQHDEVKQPVSQYSDAERAELQDKIWPEILDALRKDVPNIPELATRK